MKRLITMLLVACTISMMAQTKPCPTKGDKNNAKFQALDELKNRNIEGVKIDKTVTLESILKDGDDTKRFSSEQYVSVTGYVIKVMAGKPETCNCHSKAAADQDIHIEIALTPTAKSSEAMVVEINRFTKLKNPDYTVANIKKWVGKKVTVTGFIFFDEEHHQNARNTNPTGTDIWRGTCTEVHPTFTIVLAK